jgi:hypothetical protein
MRVVGQHLVPRLLIHLTGWVVSPVCFAQDLQPNRLDLGVLHVGSIAEASARVYWGNPQVRDGKAVVAPPAFLTIRTETTDVKPTYKGKGPCDYTDVVVSIKTAEPGEFAGSVRIVYGPQQAEVPVQVRVVAGRPGQNRVLIAETPFERFSTSDSEVFDTWRTVAESSEADISYLDVAPRGPVLRDLELSRFQVILLGETGLIHLTETDVQRLDAFIRGGGRVVVAANRFFRGSVDGLNKVVGSYGLRMLDSQEQGVRERVVEQPAITAHDLTFGVSRLKFFRASPVVVTDPQSGVLLVRTVPAAENGFIALARCEAGEVVALGQSLWWSWVIGEDVDNARFLQNLFTTPVGTR